MLSFLYHNQAVGIGWQSVGGNTVGTRRRDISDGLCFSRRYLADVGFEIVSDVLNIEKSLLKSFQFLFKTLFDVLSVFYVFNSGKPLVDIVDCLFETFNST